MKKLVQLLHLIPGILIGHSCFGFEVPTHYDISFTAFQISDMYASGSYENLGLHATARGQRFPTTPPATKNDNDKDFAHAHPPCAHGNDETLVRLVACGSMFEDAPGTRSLNHFMDPSNSGAPLSVWPTSLSSAQWALQDELSKSSSQEFSYWSARKYFYAALTTRGIASAPGSRDDLWGRTFQSIGQIIHHLQDMAQPQHVRDDAHLDKKFHDFDIPLPTPEIGLIHESRFEKYSAFNSNGVARIGSILDGGGFDPVYPRLRTQLTSPRAFWTGAAGVADYTNANFVSGRTNFTATTAGLAQANTGYPSPAPAGSGRQLSVVEAFGDEPIPTVVQQFCADVGAERCRMTFYATPVNDNESSPSSTNLRASTESVFDEDLNGHMISYAAGGRLITTARIFALNRLNFNAAYPYLIPKAVNYSAGFINYFFRGKLEIALPEAGVYALVDHAVESCKDDCGFRSIKLKVTNRTVSDALVSGDLLAVVKFRRDQCYQPSLDNDSMPLTCRSPEEEIVVSRAIPIVDPIASDATREFQFTFDTSIPINATDVLLQAVFKGQLGSEIDAVAVGTRDISEPTFVSTFNDSDRVFVGGSCYTPQEIESRDSLWNQLGPECRDQNGARRVSASCANVAFNFRYAGGSTSQPILISTVYDGAGDNRIPPRSLARFAFLADGGAPVTYNIVFHNAPLYLPTDESTINLDTNRLGESLDGTLWGGTVSSHRGVKSSRPIYVIVDGETGSPAGGCPDGQLDALNANERVPIRSAITGW